MYFQNLKDSGTLNLRSGSEQNTTWSTHKLILPKENGFSAEVLL